jgi:hypothetical protein
MGGLVAWTTHLLVIANRTVDSQELHDVLVARAQQQPIDVTLLAPASREGGNPVAARAATEQRLSDAVQNLQRAGLTVEGVIGDSDPLVAVDAVWDPRRFDEVLVMTLPEATSRWLASGLLRRVERFTGAQVTHVVAESGARSSAGMTAGDEADIEILEQIRQLTATLSDKRVQRRLQSVLDEATPSSTPSS